MLVTCHTAHAAFSSQLLPTRSAETHVHSSNPKKSLFPKLPGAAPQAGVGNGFAGALEVLG